MNKLCDQVRDTFMRVLSRSEGVEVKAKSLASCSIKLREHQYNLVVSVLGSDVVVRVVRLENFSVFFIYRCPSAQMGKIKKAALILAKKLGHREMHDVMVA